MEQKPLANKTSWTQQDRWEGNPDLGFVSYCKLFPTPNGRLVPVFVFGKTGYWAKSPSLDFCFCVSAGANSDFSYSDCCPTSTTPEETMAYVDQLAATPHPGGRYNCTKLIY